MGPAEMVETTMHGPMHNGDNGPTSSGCRSQNCILPKSVIDEGNEVGVWTEYDKWFDDSIRTCRRRKSLKKSTVKSIFGKSIKLSHKTQESGQ